ncbi:unnamed protein product [Polarella glacialis]|uniref:Inositol-pentakisphosphate 2-kinase n=1 Tax=Polarella glacialis TaxID=89957 RepID=A0A813DYV1_POLGL|nr:unnamed protein product [Polarella glacialis]
MALRRLAPRLASPAAASAPRRPEQSASAVSFSSSSRQLATLLRLRPCPRTTTTTTSPSPSSSPRKALQALEADAVAPLLLAAGAVAIGAATWLVAGSGGFGIVHERVAQPEEVCYLCEGRNNLLCAGVLPCGPSLRWGRRSWEGHLLQLQKASECGKEAQATTTCATMRKRAALQRKLAAHCFDPCYIDVPEVVALPVADVRAIDAYILASRPAKQRGQRLSIEESQEFPGRVLALRMQNLWEAPVKLEGRALQKLVSVEIQPGCGWQEIQGCPSRHSMSQQLASSAKAPADHPLALFSGDASLATATVLSCLGAKPSLPEFRIFLDGEPLHSSSLGFGTESSETSSSMGGALLAGLGFGKESSETSNSLEGTMLAVPQHLAEAVGASLAARSASGHGVMQDLRRLQYFAVGDSEKLAVRLLSELRTSGGDEAVAMLDDISQVELVIAQASRSSGDDSSVTWFCFT